MKKNILILGGLMVMAMLISACDYGTKQAVAETDANAGAYGDSAAQSANADTGAQAAQDAGAYDNTVTQDTSSQASANQDTGGDYQTSTQATGTVDDAKSGMMTNQEVVSNDAMMNNAYNTVPSTQNDGNVVIATGVSINNNSTNHTITPDEAKEMSRRAIMRGMGIYDGASLTASTQTSTSAQSGTTSASTSGSTSSSTSSSGGSSSSVGGY